MSPPPILLVAHGSPADPLPQEAAMADLAHRVAALLPGREIRGATLAQPGALAAAVTALGADARIYPFFMAKGWFTGVELPRRLKTTAHPDLIRLDPFGIDPALPALMAQVAEAGAAAAGLAPKAATLLLAAHGSRTSKRSADSTWAMAEEMRSRTRFARVAVGFVEEAPFLQEAATGLGPAVCLPFFALRAGHVEGDLPEALAAAGFDGPLLPPIGEHPEAARLIADAILRAEL